SWLRVVALGDTLIVFFFQAEDGIRDGHVTGVQTCALPISFRFAAPAHLAKQLLVEGWLGLQIGRWERVVGMARKRRSKESPAKEIGRASCRERVEISVSAASVRSKRFASQR